MFQVNLIGFQKSTTNWNLQLIFNDKVKWFTENNSMHLQTKYNPTDSPLNQTDQKLSPNNQIMNPV